MSKPRTRTVAFATTAEVRDTCLCLHVQRAARALARLFDDALRPVGLTHGQFSLLNALNRPRPATMAQVSSLLAMDRTTLTAALKPLLRDQLVDVTVHPDDARARLIALTTAGHQRLAAAIPIWRRTHAALDRTLPAPRADQFRSQLRDLGQLAPMPVT